MIKLPKFSNKKISAPAGIAFIILFAILAAGVLVWQTKSRKIYSPLKTETEIDASDWKTYRNEVFGYKVKYPAKWQIDANDRAVVAFISPGSSLVKGDAKYGEIIYIYSLYARYAEKIEEVNSFYFNNPDYEISPFHLRDIKGMKFSKSDSDEKAGGKVVLQKEQVFFSFFHNEGKMSSPTFNEMLYSFELIEPAEDCYMHDYKYECYGGSQPEYIISQWKTYRDEKYKYELAYPALWQRKQYLAFDSEPKILRIERFEPVVSQMREHPPSFSLSIFSLKERSIDSIRNNPDYNILLEEKVMIGDKEGLKIRRELKNPPSKHYPETFFVVEEGECLYQLKEWFSGENEHIWERILSTFRFFGAGERN